MDAMATHPIRAYRRAQKPPLRLEDLANRVGTTKANLSRIEGGKRKPSNKLLRKLVAETGIPAASIRPDLAGLFFKPAARPARGMLRRKRAA